MEREGGGGGGFGDLRGQALMLPADLFISVLLHEADDQDHDGIQLDWQDYKAVRLRRDARRDGWPRLADPPWRRLVIKAQRKSCTVSRNVSGRRATKATVAQEMKQREDFVCKLRSSHETKS